MKKITITYLLFFISLNILFSQSEWSRTEIVHRKMINVNTSLINSNYELNNSLFNNLEFIAYPLLKLPTVFRRQSIGIGAGIYFPHYTSQNTVFYPKISLDYFLFRKIKFSSGIFFEYLTFENNYNTGISFKYPIRLLEKTNFSYDLEIKSNFSYNSMFNKWLLNIAFGINLNRIKEVKCHYRKPVVYFYPEDTLDIIVKLDFKGDFTFTWPKYKDKWDIRIYPNSELLNKTDNKHYNYLFWEGTYLKPNKDTINSGFIVENIDLAIFLTEKLELIGINEREINDFITYWVPVLTKKKYLIHFLQNDNCNTIASYTFSENPETFIRVMVLFIETNKSEIEEQKIIKNKRTGFTVVEWGGIEI